MPHGATGYEHMSKLSKRPPGLPALRSLMESMKRPLDAVKTQRNDASPDKSNRIGSALSPMSTRESDGTSLGENDGDIAAGSTANTPSGTFERGNLKASQAGTQAGGNRMASLPRFNEDFNSFFNQTFQQIDPILHDDVEFQDEIFKLNQLYEAKLASLQAAHEESRRKIIISAMARNGKGLDVNALMEKASIRGKTERDSRDVYHKAVHNECFQVMLDNMTSNKEKNEFDDPKDEKEATNSTGKIDPLSNVKTDSAFNRSSSAFGSTDDKVDMLTSDPIAVSPTQITGKHEKVF